MENEVSPIFSLHHVWIELISTCSTNATISYTENNTIANLALGGENLQIQLLSPSGATFATMEPVPFSSDPATPSGSASQNLPNPDVSVLTISLAAGTNTIQVSSPFR